MADVVCSNGDVPTPTSPRAPDTLASVTALARFEFEPGRGNEGTKVLMIEWQDEAKSRDPGSWRVSWPGKATVLPADEKESDDTRRLYFLLPPNTAVPPYVTLSYLPSADAQDAAQTLTINPLPAIFTPELGATVKASGKKGVLHTIWAKKRLQVLEREIEREQEHNLEGIALEMALSEKDWIDRSFGLGPKPPTLNLSSTSKYTNGSSSLSPQSPRSPGGRKLSDKLKGLSIGTSEKDLRVNTPMRESHPMSPDGSDVAYSSFNTFRNGPAAPGPAVHRKTFSPQSPPDHIKKQQSKSPMASLDYIAQQTADDTEDGLFAKKLSPRTPDIAKSPFSFSSADIAPFSKIKGDQ